MPFTFINFTNKKSTLIQNEFSYESFQIFAIILIALQLALFCFKINDNFYGSDFGNYWQGAQSILTGSVYSTHGSNLVPDSFRPFSYPLVLAIFIFIFNQNYQFYLIGFQAFLCLLMLILTFNLLKKINLLNTKSIIIVTILFSHPTWLYIATQMQCDIFVAYFAFLYIYFIVNFYNTRKSKDLYIAVIMISVSLYFRPFYLYFIPLIIISIAIWGRTKSAIIAALIFLIITTPWIARNKIVLDSYKFSMLGEIALAYIAGDTIRHAQGMDQNEAYYYILRESGVGENFENSKENPDIYKKLNRYSINVIIQNPIFFVQATGRGLIRVFIMPHEIYKLQENTTIPVDKFIDKIRKKPMELLLNVNIYFIYLYILPILINIFVLLNIAIFIFKISIWRPKNLCIVLTALSIFFYGLILPGAINKSHYISLYYLSVILIVVFTMNRFGERI